MAKEKQKYEKLQAVAPDRHRLQGFSEKPENKENVKLVPAVEKAIRIITLINQAQKSLSLAEIAQELEITKSHCHGLLKTLTYFDWLRFDPATKTYRLHTGMIRDYSAILRERTSPTQIRPQLEAFCEAVQVSCVLSEPLSDATFLVLDNVSASTDIEISYPTGYRLPQDAPAHMRAFLAWHQDHEIDEYLANLSFKKYTRHSVTDPVALREELARTRERGYARSKDEFVEGIMAMALPIFDQEGKVMYIFDCVGRTEAILPREEVISAQLIRSVDTLHRLFASLPPPTFPHPNMRRHRP